MMVSLRLLAIFATIVSPVLVSADCTFTPQCDYGRGSRDSEPAATQADCCALCTNRPGCAAGVYDGTACWFKTASEVAGGCKTSARVKAACIPPSVKPGPTPPAPPTPPHPTPPPSPGPPGPPAPPKPPSPTPPPQPKPPLPPTPPSAKCGAGEKPVQVFILMGQSNMLGEGRRTGNNNSLEYAVQTAHKYQYLWDSSIGNWSTSKTVRNVEVMSSGGMATKYGVTLFDNEFMTAARTTAPPMPGYKNVAKGTIGPELGIGFALGAYTTEPVMTLKSCTGDRALGWDLLPPGTARTEFTLNNVTYIEAGYHDSPQRWVKGTTPVPIGWYAGVQYDGDMFRASNVLGNISDFYPGSTCYEVAGFFWWQGDRDSRDIELSTLYEANLVQLIKQLRLQFNSPNAKFVSASLGQTVQGDKNGGGLILNAMQNVANATKYPEFKGTVAAVYSHPLMHTPSSSGSHYGGDAYTYMNIGTAMGDAMVGLLKGSE